MVLLPVQTQGCLPTSIGPRVRPFLHRSARMQGSSPFGPVNLRESPTLASLGSVEEFGTVSIDASDTPTTVGSSPFMISSFFDVFTELSIDGGQSWNPGQSSTHIELMPEPGSLSLAAIVSIGLLKRRKR